MPFSRLDAGTPAAAALRAGIIFHSVAYRTVCSVKREAKGAISLLLEKKRSSLYSTIIFCQKLSSQNPRSMRKMLFLPRCGWVYALPFNSRYTGLASRAIGCGSKNSYPYVWVGNLFPGFSRSRSFTFPLACLGSVKTDALVGCLQG